MTKVIEEILLIKKKPSSSSIKKIHISFDCPQDITTITKTEGTKNKIFI